MAQMEEGGLLADAGGLLHRMGDNHDREIRAQLVYQLLDLRGSNRIKRRTGLVHQQHFGLGRHRAGDAQPLLLATRKGRCQANGAGP